MDYISAAALSFFIGLFLCKVDDPLEALAWHQSAELPPEDWVPFGDTERLLAHHGRIFVNGHPKSVSLLLSVTCFHHCSTVSD